MISLYHNCGIYAAAAIAACAEKYRNCGSMFSQAPKSLILIAP